MASSSNQDQVWHSRNSNEFLGKLFVGKRFVGSRFVGKRFVGERFVDKRSVFDIFRS